MNPDGDGGSKEHPEDKRIWRMRDAAGPERRRKTLAGSRAPPLQSPDARRLDGRGPGRDEAVVRNEQNAPVCRVRDLALILLSSTPAACPQFLLRQETL